MGKFDKYAECSVLFSCPVCGKGLTLNERALTCAEKHSFDIAKQGYVNLYRGKPVNEYSKESFQERQQILNKGMYKHILDEICDFLSNKYRDESCGKKVLIDAGCGEGYYSREIALRLGEKLKLDIFGADISRDSVKIAAGTANGMGSIAADIKWLVADIGNLPVRNGQADIILDIFTSANYQEFKRVLSESGYIIKVIPGSGHVRELRQAAMEQLFHKNYDERKGSDIFGEHFDIIYQKTVSKSFNVTPEERDIFINMTPLLFQVDKSKIDWNEIDTITVEGEILIGKKKAKDVLRKEIGKRGRKLKAEYRRSADQAIFRKVVARSEYKEANTVALFSSAFSEPDTWPIIKNALSAGKIVGLPLCLSDGNMKMMRITGKKDLEPGTFNILQPKTSCEEIKPESIDFVLVPCVTCDREGRRLGHGKGYYDKYFDNCKQAFKCLICYDKLMSDEVPVDSWDVKMDLIIGEVTEDDVK